MKPRICRGVEIGEDDGRMNRANLILGTGWYRKKDVRSPSLKTPVGSRDGAYGLSPYLQTSTHVSTPQSDRSKIPVNLSTPQSWSKDFIVLGGPDESIGQRLGKNKMGSIVGRMKANPRKASFIPILKSPYYVPKNKRTKVNHPNPNYCLNHAERSCLEEFWIRLYSNHPILEDRCSTIPKEEMHQTLKKSWMDTLIMDHLLFIVGEHCVDTLFFCSTLAHFEVQQKTAEIDFMFTCNKNRDFWTFKTIIFPIWFKHHFFVIIGYPKEWKFVYYNSMMGCTSYDDYAHHFVEFLRKKFLDVGWCDPVFYNFEIGNPNPQQDNNCDCGIFTMANAEHVAYRRAIEYTQADIWYYQQKIVIDIYQKQKQLYSYFFESQNIS